MAAPNLINIEKHSWKRDDGYELSTDRHRIDFDLIYKCLTEDSYWFSDLTEAQLQQALDASLVIGVYGPNHSMAGFARVVTDCAIFAYLRDVFILPDHRSKGLASWLSLQIRTHPQLKDVTTWMLRTQDAHNVYRKAGYEITKEPDWLMIYKKL